MNSVEKQILTKVVQELVVEGYLITVDYERGFDSEPENRNLTNLAEITDAADATDECHLMVDREELEEGPYEGFVYFIWGNGNSGRDCISDYSTNLEGIIGPILEWVDCADLQLKGN